MQIRFPLVARKYGSTRYLGTLLKYLSTWVRALRGSWARRQWVDQAPEAPDLSRSLAPGSRCPSIAASAGASAPDCSCALRPQRARACSSVSGLLIIYICRGQVASALAPTYIVHTGPVDVTCTDHLAPGTWGFPRWPLASRLCLFQSF